LRKNHFGKILLVYPLTHHNRFGNLGSLKLKGGTFKGVFTLSKGGMEDRLLLLSQEGGTKKGVALVHSFEFLKETLDVLPFLWS